MSELTMLDVYGAIREHHQVTHTDMPGWKFFIHPDSRALYGIDPDGNDAPVVIDDKILDPARWQIEPGPRIVKGSLEWAFFWLRRGRVLLHESHSYTGYVMTPDGICIGRRVDRDRSEEYVHTVLATSSTNDPVLLHERYLTGWTLWSAR